ncbi:hypothetical protein KY389_11570 [Paracoccus bogoriensis]|uniref:hypothetical protein n=1 Tax=Paracoccus bogoriensis TaxID=242065 RepID=UPI001CA4F316|nr:hypothetical protein [Paracoccus bogoriensis]MBW7057324.1 hypothetical protein [Paracoccus bogoriensis]
MSVIDLDVCDDHRLALHEINPGSDKLLICFSRKGGGMGQSGFGTEFCKKNGWNHLYVGHTPRSRYQSLSFERFQDCVFPVLEGRDVITYGPSAGGYAALYFGGAVDARILAASPRNTYHPIRTNAWAWEDGEQPESSDGRFRHRARLKDLPRSSHAPTILYDPRDGRDSALVKRWALPAYPDAKLMHVPNSGHRSLDYLSRIGSLSYFVRSFVEQTPIDPERLLAPKGTIERALQDGATAYEAQDYDRAAVLLGADISELRTRGLLDVYLSAVALSKNPSAAVRIKGWCDAELLSAKDLRPWARRDLEKVLGAAAVEC